jgi:uroporphyrinogen decarboxylase
MTTKERWARTLDHREADRVPIYDAVWGTTAERWRREGLPAGVSVADYFHHELAAFGGVGTFDFPEETVEETPDYLISRNANGALAKHWKHLASTPEFLDYTLKTRADWEEHKPRLLASAGRIDWEAARAAQTAAEETDRVLAHWACLGFERAQQFLGTERLLLAMVEEPEWIEDMYDTFSRLACTGLEEMAGRGIVFDLAWVSDDMGYRNGTLFSPAMFRRFEFPNHQRYYDCCRGQGLKVVLHSDGDLRAFLPMLIEAGLSCLQPLEVKAGMNVVALKQQYGEVLSFMGGIDVRKMAHPDPAVIEEEIASKIGFAKRGGGYLYHSDHSVPDDVSWERYCLVMELVKKYGSYV